MTGRGVSVSVGSIDDAPTGLGGRALDQAADVAVTAGVITILTGR
ncbi:hypothetical protein [Alloactinosynnema sp. L-07]|nr:hypothetical protein [Alloactinosynnema sp. L-07]